MNIASKGSTRIAAIDGFRGLAMVLVLAYHSWNFCGSPKWVVGALGFDVDLLSFLRGNSRVDLFIVLSGFCLFLPLAKSAQALEKWDLRDYAIRRAQRILPAYYAALIFAIFIPNALVALVHLMGKEANWQTWPSAFNIITHALFIHTFFADTWAGLNPAIWTMALEVQFYATFPIIIFLIRRFGMKSLIGVIAASLVYRVVVAHLFGDLPWPYNFLPQITFMGRWMQFAMGIFAIWFVMRQLQQGKMYSPLVGTLGVLGACFIHYIAASKLITFTSSREVFLGLSFTLLIISVCLSKTPARIFFENKLITSLGYVSYSLFLVHQPIVYYMSEIIKKAGHVQMGLTFFLWFLPLGLVATLIVGLPLFYFFERPYLVKKATRPKGPAEVNDETILAKADLVPGINPANDLDPQRV